VSAIFPQGFPMDLSSVWRLITSGDIPTVLSIADRVHPDFPEDLAIFAERQRLYPAGAYLFEREGTACGYLISHPWHSGAPPALNRLIHHLPPDADVFYLHDLALLPGGRGQGAARAILDRIVEHARSSGFSTMRLIAVNRSVPFWQHLGFDVEDSAQAADYVRSYGKDARLMVRSLS